MLFTGRPPSSAPNTLGIRLNCSYGNCQGLCVHFLHELEWIPRPLMPPPYMAIKPENRPRRASVCPQPSAASSFTRKMINASLFSFSVFLQVTLEERLTASFKTHMASCSIWNIFRGVQGALTYKPSDSTYKQLQGRAHTEISEQCGLLSHAL